MNRGDASLPPEDSQSALEGEYRKLIRWYPRWWRKESEDAMIGALLDQAEKEERDHPTEAERSALRRAGFAQWFGFPVRGQRLRLIPLIAGGALSLFYSTLIIWSPRTNYPGSLGPFSNPSIITCALLVLALVFGLFVRARIARILAFAAAAVEIVVGIGAAAHPAVGPSPWEGPSPSTVVLFTGIAILSGIALGRGWSLATGALLILAGTAAAISASYVQAQLGTLSTVSTILLGFVAVSVAGAIVLILLHQKPRRPSAPTNARD